jgi:hypothetical protein
MAAFNELYKLGCEGYCENDSGIPMLAATDGNIGKIFIPNPSDATVNITLELPNGWEATELRVLDGKRGLVAQDTSAGYTLAPFKICIIECKRA